MGLECSAGAGGVVRGAWAGESAGSAVGGAEDWSNVGRAASSVWSWTSMAGVGLSMVIGSVRIRVRHAHASLMVAQEKACGARRWTLQCGPARYEVGYRVLLRCVG